MQIQLRNYQQPTYDNIVSILQNNINGVSIVVAMPTGSGKSVVIGKLANTIKNIVNSINGRTLILTHRAEILQQNSDWLHNYGLLTSKIDDVRNSNNVVIAMVQTLHARIKKYGINYIGEFDNIIVDEAHILIYEKVYSLYNYKFLIGFTGTPVLNKKLYKTINDIKYSRLMVFSDMYNTLVQGLDTQDLIDINYLVQDYNIVLQQPNISQLKISNNTPDGYTSASLNKVYTNTASRDVLWKAYSEHCKGKKTIIFNPTTRVNTYIYDYLLEKGINVKVYDSVVGGDRNEVVGWFNDTRDGVLINANVFTTGFNVTDVECVIVNRKTKSLSLWLQMVGRGGRITDKILKDFFTVIDLGDNISEHGIWSKRRDWNNWFKPDVWKPVKTVDLLTTWDCPKCQAINTYEDLTCVNCGFDINLLDDFKEEKELKTRTGELVIINKMPLPRGDTIIEYARRINPSAIFALNLLENKIIQLFMYYNVTREFYDNRKVRFRDRIREIYIPIYFMIINDRTLKRHYTTLESRLEKLYVKIDKIYF